ncbi:Transcription repressor OFP17 [Ananas comosus]|uniref:Transcription repressor OFP17 n=1 Tax=Ananas comosus TaxID=4615 RepID=A0A199VRY1_ANACO|nr:Transcription repressor OFP17 [Ananas comosus]
MPTSPCIRIPRIFNRSFSLQAFKFLNLHEVVEKMSPRRRNKFCKFRSIRAVFWPLVSMRSEETLDKIGELPSMSIERVQAPLPSPVTPAYIKMACSRREREGGVEAHDEVEEACRSFENYLMEMLVEEREVRDLMDVEELLDCWDSLKCPEFIELVCRFYGELCKDLFPSDLPSEAAATAMTANENAADKKLIEK